jgi:hypothetical protein
LPYTAEHDNFLWLYRNVLLKRTQLLTLDFLSKDKNSDMGWMLNTEVFQLAQKIFGKCDIDLFASKDNHQLSKYISYLPDKYSDLILNYGKKFPALRDSKNKYSNSCCPKKKF